MFIIALVLCIIFYFLVEHCTTIMIFLMIGGSIVALVIFGFVNWNKYNTIMAQSTLKETEAKSFRTYAIVCWVFAGVFLLLVLCLISSIKLAAKMISVASDFVNERQKSLLVPIFLVICFFVFLIWWICSFVMIFSTGTLRYDEGDLFGDMIWETATSVAVGFMLFAAFWMCFFLIATNDFVIACQVIGWYFFRKNPSLEKGMLTYFRWAWW